MLRDDKRYRAVCDMCHDDEGKELATQEFDIIILKVFNFHSLRWVIMTKIEREAAKIDTCQLKIDTGSGGNLMTMTMYNALFHIQT